MKLALDARQKEFALFGGIALALTALWLLGYELYAKDNTGLDIWLNNLIAEQAAQVIGWFGPQTVVVDWYIYPHLIVVDGHPSVSIATKCNGLPMLYMYAAFLLAYSGPWQRKAWFIPLGLLIIHTLNVLRVVGLAYLIMSHSPLAFEINHKYVFQILVYSAMGLLWLHWILYLGQANLTVRQGFVKLIRLEFLRSLFHTSNKTSAVA